MAVNYPSPSEMEHAALQTQLSKMEAEIREIREQIANGEEDHEMHQRIGHLLMSLQRYDDAEKELKRSLELDDVYFPAMMDLAYIAQVRGNFDVAIDYLKRAIKRANGYAPAKTQLGILYMALGKHEEAIRYFERATKINMYSGVALAGLATSHEALGHKELAEEYRKRAQEQGVPMRS